ncbi:PAP2 superfamily protein [Luteibacter sp. UNCMF331Sha3.1]|uniref:phosphatase PAP2 family protein n=1 Tax=Luteibacter sp. UNCMF331Sha3.1 TaxID=1502760 RepID=UPI0008C48A4B|nr:phosphatase PAP2 family protein [Luteibacter sp. UNCMF331Sha3.1]SEN18475.1 PAP2 superfamily protein [Luteibacter sp. UNCMF331Sha3.1]
MRKLTLRLTACLIFSLPLAAIAGGGPLGIDHRVSYDNHGIWKRTYQERLLYGSVLAVGAGALVFGADDDVGDTFWRSTDAMVITAAATTTMKYAFRRERPSDTDSPDRWFRSGSARSFPSGEVAALSAAVVPFIVKYSDDYPVVYALALLPAYDAVARVKVRAHWQSDVLAGAAIGVSVGIWATRRSESPIILGWLPGGFRVGFVHRFR